MSAIVVASFGTSYRASREASIGHIEKRIAGAYPEYSVRRAFTSGFIIKKIARDEGIRIPNVDEALEQLADEREREAIVCPTHFMDGKEYRIVADAVSRWKGRFDKLALGAPLLFDDADYDKVTAILLDSLGDIGNDECVIFMGHGLDESSNEGYARMQELLKQAGRTNCIVCTVEGEPSFAQAVEQARQGAYRKAFLRTFMVVAGVHAREDMAGEGKGSLKSRLETVGIEVEVIPGGLGELDAIADIYVEHVAQAIAQV